MFRQRNQIRVTQTSGFTLIELLIVIAIIAVLATAVFSAVGGAQEATYAARANSEFEAFESAMVRYQANNLWQYPGDVNRGIPPGLEPYLSSGDWPDAPWPDSVYDWDVFTPAGEDTVYQISIRFCPIGGPLSACRFPDREWAENFDVNSSYFFCFDGPCRAHPSQPQNHPGYCVNCACKEMETC